MATVGVKWIKKDKTVVRGMTYLGVSAKYSNKIFKVH